MFVILLMSENILKCHGLFIQEKYGLRSWNGGIDLDQPSVQMNTFLFLHFFFLKVDFSLSENEWKK